MANAYVCDVTGELLAGEPTRVVSVDVSERLRADVVVYARREDGTKPAQADLSPKVAAAITAAVKGALAS